jgi:hypothetical protein
MTRTEILTRYRRLRQISKELHQAVLDVVAPKVVLDWAKRLGLARARTVLLESEQEMILAEDLAIYLTRPGRPHPLNRYARAARLPPGSDEAIVLEAMRQAQFSLWRIERGTRPWAWSCETCCAARTPGWSTKPWKGARNRDWRWPRVS